MSTPQIRIVTYLCPSIPLELFQNILQVLEENTKYQTTLQYEWRSDGFSEERLDPFQSNLIDMAFMPSSGYIALMEKKNTFAELLPITPIFRHPKNNQHRHTATADSEYAIAGTYVDVIVHSDKLKHRVNTILDLRGCRWACVREESLANCVMLNTLQQHGENITFFGSTHRAFSHLAAVNMVLTKQVDVATVDASSLICNRRCLHNGAKEIVVLNSFGPYAPYAIVINNRINGDLKNKIISSFASINCKDTKFDQFGLLRFVPNHPDAYEKEIRFKKTIKSEMSNVPYY